MDCGDHSCLFAEQRGGMRTNGGCRCLDDLEPSKAKAVRRAWLTLQASRESYKTAYELAEAETRGLCVTVEDITGQPVADVIRSLKAACRDARSTIPDGKPGSQNAKVRAALDAVLGRR